MASIDRTAYPRFARAVSTRELAEVFTPSAVEVEWARGKTQDDQHLLALLVWLKAYQRLGYFPKFKDVPAVVSEHIRSVIGLPEEVVLEDAAERSAKRHRSFVRERMGVTYDAARVREVADEAIRKAAQAKDNPADLINVALEELVRAECELPGEGGQPPLVVSQLTVSGAPHVVQPRADTQATDQVLDRAGMEARVLAGRPQALLGEAVGDLRDGAPEAARPRISSTMRG
ncbi:DUF4158 domain-containing protein [Streptosporangium canum]|uniref:DUF4158 domain-containing protein n=1 Tax=Streptosporangium canum TaxID=324952 RepID=UPI00379B9486